MGFFFFLPRTTQTTRTFSPKSSSKSVLLLISLIFCFFLFSCVKKEATTEEEIVAYIDPLRVRATEISSAMEDRLLIAQLLISGIDGREKLSQNTIDMLTDIPTGGIMLFKYNLNSDKDSISTLLSETSALIKEISGIAPFMAVDHEGGSVNRFPVDIAYLPDASSYRETSDEELSQREQILVQGKILTTIYEDSLRAGLELSALGINMNFAPVAEHLTDENRFFLSRRSYGEDQDFVSRAASAFVNGMGLAGVLCVVKHFPGSAGKDPHYSASVLDLDKNSANKFVSPFAYAINNRARAIMAAHTLIPAIDSEIASLSSVVMTDWLRGELGFSGIIISDDFTMAAAGKLKPEEAAVRSVAAGSDMILVWPAHLKITLDAFTAALENEHLSRERLLEAAQRVIYEKLRMGLVE